MSQVVLLLAIFANFAVGLSLVKLHASSVRDDVGKTKIDVGVDNTSWTAVADYLLGHGSAAAVDWTDSSNSSQHPNASHITLPTSTVPEPRRRHVRTADVSKASQKDVPEANLKEMGAPSDDGVVSTRHKHVRIADGVNENQSTPTIRNASGLLRTDVVQHKNQTTAALNNATGASTQGNLVRTSDVLDEEHQEVADLNNASALLSAVPSEQKNETNAGPSNHSDVSERRKQVHTKGVPDDRHREAAPLRNASALHSADTLKEKNETIATPSNDSGVRIRRKHVNTGDVSDDGRQETSTLHNASALHGADVVEHTKDTIAAPSNGSDVTTQRKRAAKHHHEIESPSRGTGTGNIARNVLDVGSKFVRKIAGFLPWFSNKERDQSSAEMPRKSREERKMKAAGSTNTSGEVELYEVEFQRAAETHDDAAMSALVQRMLANEDKFIPQEEEGQLAGFVEWFSGTKATQGFTRMVHELSDKDWVKDMHETLAAPGVTEAQYQTMAAVRSDTAMTAFVRKLVASENKFIPQADEGQLAGFVQWFSGTKATQTLAQMREELFSKFWVKDVQAFKSIEAEFEATASLHDDVAMSAFLKKFLATEGKFIPPEEESRLVGFVPWYTGALGNQSFDQMRKELLGKSWIKDLPATAQVPQMKGAQYQSMTASSGDAEISIYLKKCLARENKYISKEDEGHFVAFVKSVSGRTTTQGFAEARKELLSKSWVKDALATKKSPAVTEAQYYSVVELNNIHAMSIFAKRLLASENIFIPEEDEGRLADFAQWLHDRKTTPDLEHMRQELLSKSWVKGLPSTKKAPEATEAQYYDTVALNDTNAMSGFVKELLASESKFIPKEDEGRLADFALWLRDRKTIPDLEHMRQELLSKSWVKSKPSTKKAPEATEAQYYDTVARNDSDAMSGFLKKFLAAENKFIPEEDQGRLADFVQWLANRKTTPDLEHMREELFSKQWVRDSRTSIQTGEAARVKEGSTNSQVENVDKHPRPIALFRETLDSVRTELTETEYQKVAALRDDVAMGAFAKRMLASEDMFVPQEEESQFAGFVQWFSGTKATQNLAQMREELLRKPWVKNMHETLAARGVTEAQYQTMAALQSDIAMTAFVKKLLASENKFIPQAEEGQLAGFVQWFSGTKATQTLAQMREELFSKSWVHDGQSINASPAPSEPVMLLRSLPSDEVAETEYQKVAALRDDVAMASFAKRMLELEDKFIPLEEEGQFLGFVQWFSGTRATQSFSKMWEELARKSWVKDLRARLATPDVTEAQYRDIAELHNDAAMSAFARKILAVENKYVPQDAEGELEGFVQWFSGTKATQSLAQMREELLRKSWVRNMQASSTAPVDAGVVAVANSVVSPAGTASSSSGSAPVAQRLMGGAGVPITEKDYQAMAALHNDAGMVAFIKMLLARENKFVPPGEELQLEGFVPWFSGTKAIQTLQQMQQELSTKSWVKDKPTRSIGGK